MEKTERMHNVKKLEKAGILNASRSLSPDDKRVLESLTEAEVEAWIRIKQKLDAAGVLEQECKFFI